MVEVIVDEDDVCVSVFLVVRLQVTCTIQSGVVSDRRKRESNGGCKQTTNTTRS
jgi:hypothetical protein